MPGNEVGDRVHNFFEQGSLSQDQRHNQVLDGNWPVFSNNVWGGNERQIGGQLNSGSKNYTVQQSDVERGQGNQFSLSPHGLNASQSNLRSEFVKNQTQLQQLNLSGFMHSSQIVHTRENETNFLGMDTEPDRHNLTSRGLPNLESQQRSSPQNINSASFRGSESAMNFNFLGGQQQLSGQQPGMPQSFPRQQSAVSDGQQSLQQQVILKQMQEMQRHNQQLQHFEAMQRNAVSQMSNFPNQMGGQHSPAINGNPLHDSSNYPWQPQVMASNTNWPQSGISAMQGYSNGLMITPEQGQALRFMGLIPQQASQSLYGVPVTNARNSNQLSYNSSDKPGMLQLSAPASPFSGIQYVSPTEKGDMHDGNTVSRSGSEGKNSFEHASGQRFRDVVTPGSVNQMQQRNVSMLEVGREDSAGDSELLPEKSATPATSSQTAVPLDQTEEKILYGDDDNIWEAFGSPSLTGTGGGTRLEGTDLFNGLSGVQSGTWSALMQSAVAETSSSDVGIQEEWSGLGSQNSRTQSGNQHPSVLHENEKRPIWIDSAQRASFCSQTSTNDVSTTNYLNTTGFPQPSPKNATEALQTEIQIPQEGIKWLDRNQLKPHAEQNRSLENAASRDAVFWSHQQGTFSHDNSGKPSRSALNFIESVPSNGGIAPSSQENFHGQQQNRHGAVTRFESLPASNVKMGGLDETGTQSQSNMKGNTAPISQKFSDNNHIDLWKPVNYSVKSGSSGSGSDQYNLNNGPPILESSVVMSDGGAEMYEAENGDQTENSSDSHRSSVPYHKENLWSDAGDRSSLPVGKEKSSDQAGKKAHVTRKFQYHPMGDVVVDMDSESSYVSKEVLHSQSMVQHLSSGVKGQETQKRFSGPLSSSSVDTDKGCVSDVHEANKMSHGLSSSGIHPGYFPNTSAPFARSGEISSSNQHVSSSQNMLELLHKVDQSMEQNMASTRRLSLNQSQPSTSHGFSLQLAPPSQRFTPSSLQVASQISSRSIDSPNPDHVDSDKGDKPHAWLTAVSSQMRAGNNRAGIVGTIDGDGAMQNQKGKLLAPLSSGYSYLRNTLPNQHFPAASGKIVTDQSFDRHVYHDIQSIDSQDQAAASQAISNLQNSVASGRYMNQSGMKASMHQVPGSLPAIMPGMSRKDNLSPLGSNQWTSQQQLWGAQAHNASDLRNSQIPPNGTLETSSHTQHKKNDQDSPRISSQGIVGGNIQQTTESVVRHTSDVSPSNSAASQKDYEESHYSIKSSSASHHSYSLLHQMHPRLIDPSQRESKRLKGPDNDPDTQASQPLSGGVVRDASGSQSLISSEDAKSSSFSSQPGNRNASFQYPYGTVGSQDMLPIGRSDLQKFAAAGGNTRGEHAGISPQMAPSWFEQYGTFKNGQLLTGHNVTRVPVTKNVEELLNSGMSANNLIVNSRLQQLNAVSDTGLMDNTCQTISSYTAMEHDSARLVPHVSMPSVASLRPKKRKTATSDLLPWNEEIEQGFNRLQNLSSAELDWAQSSNRLVEKFEYETDPSEDLGPMVRPRRRLILTAQLMQQVFRPPSAAVLSLDGSSSYEIIVYSLARLALGDACSLICCTEGDPRMHLDSGNLRCEKVNTSERTRDQHFTKVIEDLSCRAKELENDLSRLDKRASILDFRLDCQDLERFSVINRFARFHGRGQVDGAESSSSSEAAAVTQRPCPQRYVYAHPMPRTVPESVQCLSL